MAMTWNSLSASKGQTGSIANWVSFTLLDLPPIIDEAQALLWASLRTREMMTSYYFSLFQGQCAVPLPAGFLDPIGRIWIPTQNLSIRHKDQNSVMTKRNFSETQGTLGANPFTTSLGSMIVAVNLPGHGFSQESLFNVQGATAVNGITPNGTFPISSLIDVNNFNIDTSVLGQAATGAGSGGGSAVNYVCDGLVQASLEAWSIWDEAIKFDAAALQQYQCQMQYFRSLPLLSNANPSNFLTNRYPQLMRRACVTAAYDFMEDDAQYQKSLTALVAMIQLVNAENDGQYRGMETDMQRV